VIDDEEAVRKSFALALEDTGCTVDAAASGYTGIEKVETVKYDLIFLDVLMPKIEGREALEMIRKICDTPVVVISAYLPPDKRGEVLEAGAVESLPKPFDLGQTLQVIHWVMAAQELKKGQGR